MGFKSDIEIAQEAKPQDIREIAKKLGIASRKSEVCDTVLLNDELKKGEKHFDKFIKEKKK